MSSPSEHQLQLQPAGVSGSSALAPVETRSKLKLGPSATGAAVGASTSVSTDADAAVAPLQYVSVDTAHASAPSVSEAAAVAVAATAEYSATAIPSFSGVTPQDPTQNSACIGAACSTCLDPRGAWQHAVATFVASIEDIFTYKFKRPAPQSGETSISDGAAPPLRPMSAASTSAAPLLSEGTATSTSALTRGARPLLPFDVIRLLEQPALLSELEYAVDAVCNPRVPYTSSEVEVGHGLSRLTALSSLAEVDRAEVEVGCAVLRACLTCVSAARAALLVDDVESAAAIAEYVCGTARGSAAAAAAASSSALSGSSCSGSGDGGASVGGGGDATSTSFTDATVGVLPRVLTACMHLLLQHEEEYQVEVRGRGSSGAKSAMSPVSTAAYYSAVHSSSFPASNALLRSSSSGGGGGSRPSNSRIQVEVREVAVPDVSLNVALTPLQVEVRSGRSALTDLAFALLLRTADTLPVSLRDWWVSPDARNMKNDAEKFVAAHVAPRLFTAQLRRLQRERGSGSGGGSSGGMSEAGTSSSSSSSLFAAPPLPSPLSSSASSSSTTPSGVGRSAYPPPQAAADFSNASFPLTLALLGGPAAQGGARCSDRSAD